LTATGDPELLRIVLENLPGNAWKFTGKRQRSVIELGASETDGAVSSFVRDNGPGFPMDEAEKLFFSLNAITARCGLKENREKGRPSISR